MSELEEITISETSYDNIDIDNINELNFKFYLLLAIQWLIIIFSICLIPYSFYFVMNGSKLYIICIMFIIYMISSAVICGWIANNCYCCYKDNSNNINKNFIGVILICDVLLILLIYISSLYQ